MGAALANPSSSQAAQGCQLPDRLASLGQSVNYTGASLAFDGQYLDYTETGTYSSGPNRGKAATGGYNRVFTIDPRHSCNTSGTPEYDIPTDLTNGSEVPIYQVTYDPKYQFSNGDLGAILARAGSGVAAPGLKSGYDAPVYAIDPQTKQSELAFGVLCQTIGNSCLAEPSLFAYDPFRDRIWVSIPPFSQDPNAPAFIPQLISVPAQRGAEAQVDPSASCMSNYDVPRDEQANFDPKDTATWAVGASDTLYVQMEDDVTVRQVNSRTCQDAGGGFTHSFYNEASDENDQMVCDPVTYGQGAGGTSVLWLRDTQQHAVEFYSPPGLSCPAPTTLSLTAHSLGAGASQPLTSCAVLRKYITGQPPLGGMTLSFALAQRSIGRVVTDASGQGCVTFQTPPRGGTLQLVVNFAGTGALLAAQDIGSVVVRPPQVPAQAAAADKPPQTGTIAPQSAPPPPAPVQQLSIGPQVQSQVQAQTQVQLQPGMSMDQEQQVQLTVQGLNGDRRSSGLSAVARDPSPVVVLLIQLTAGLLMGIALLQRDRILEARRLVRPARDRR